MKKTRTISLAAGILAAVLALSLGLPALVSAAPAAASAMKADGPSVAAVVAAVAADAHEALSAAQAADAAAKAAADAAAKAKADAAAKAAKAARAARATSATRATVTRTASASTSVRSTGSELAQAQSILASLKATYPRYLSGVTVTFGDARGYQAISYYTSGQIVISPTHTASLSRILKHEIWHIIDWRDNGRIDWRESVPPANASDYR